MLRPSATKIVLTRDEIRHLRSKETIPRYPYHDSLSLARGSDVPALSPVANLHIARGLPFRTRPRGPRHAETSGSDETSSTQSTLPSSSGYDFEQDSEATVSLVGPQRTHQSPVILCEGRGLRETLRQSPGASEDISDTGNLSLSARDMHPNPEEVASSSLEMELPSSDLDASQQRKARQDRRGGELLMPQHHSLLSPLAAAPAELWASPAGPKDFDGPQTPTIRCRDGKGWSPVMISRMARAGAVAPVAGRDLYSLPHAEMERSAAVIPAYDDSLEPSSQPQTPLNPRHRGRVREASAVVSSSQAFSGARPEAATLTGSRRRRGGSPIGLQTPGFPSLFGGLGNADGFVSS